MEEEAGDRSVTHPCTRNNKSSVLHAKRDPRYIFMHDHFMASMGACGEMTRQAGERSADSVLRPPGTEDDELFVSYCHLFLDLILLPNT